MISFELMGMLAKQINLNSKQLKHSVNDLQPADKACGRKGDYDYFRGKCPAGP